LLKLFSNTTNRFSIIEAEEEEGKESKETEGKAKSSSKSGEGIKSEMLSGDPSEEVTDIHSFMEKTIKVESEKEEKEKVKVEGGDRKFSTTKHVPYTTRFDKLVEWNKKVTTTTTRFDEAFRTACKVSGKLAVELERLLKSKENEQWILERERGALALSRLANIAVNPNYRTPFKQKQMTETRNVAVQIVVDLSGSMGSNNKINIARLTAIAMSEALRRIDISHEIVGFNTEHMRRSTIENGVRTFNRKHSALVHHVFKTFESKSIKALSAMEAEGANCDGESLRFFAKRILERKEKRKIMIVISDGFPSLDEGECREILNTDLKMAINQIERENVQVVGVGVMTDAVKHFYKDHIVVTKIEDLVTAALKKLKVILVND
jgi:cobaltochelatase CobT